MDPFFQQVYFDNSLWQYTELFLTVVVAYLVAVFLHVTVFRKLRDLAAQTPTKTDDKIIYSMQRSLNVIAFIAGIYFGRGFLTLTEQVDNVVNSVLLVLITLEVTRIIASLTAGLIERYINRVALRRKDVNQDLLRFFQTLSRIVIWIVGMMLIINNLGYNIASLLAGLGIGGLAFALAAQQTLGNLFGSISIIADHPFKVGDVVMVDAVKGTVKHIGLQSTRFVTFDGTEVSMPNSKTASTVIENFSRRPSIKIQNKLGLEYDTSVTKLQKAVKTIRDILKKRKAVHNYRVHFTQFADSALIIDIIYWIEYFPQWDDVLQEQHNINIEIKKQLEKEKISFAFPTQTIHLKQES
jgi:MscS family membrane protein